MRLSEMWGIPAPAHDDPARYAMWEQIRAREPEEIRSVLTMLGRRASDAVLDAAIDDHDVMCYVRGRQMREFLEEFPITRDDCVGLADRMDEARRRYEAKGPLPERDFWKRMGL